MKRMWCPRCHQQVFLSVPLRGLAFATCSNKTCVLPSLQLGSPAFAALVTGKLSPNSKLSPVAPEPTK